MQGRQKAGFTLSDNVGVFFCPNFHLKQDESPAKTLMTQNTLYLFINAWVWHSSAEQFIIFQGECPAHPMQIQQLLISACLSRPQRTENSPVTEAAAIFGALRGN